MNRAEAKDFYPILQAFAEGKIIECRTKPSSLKGSDTPNEWTEMGEIEFWNNTEYRIKPEPKYRQFKDSEECWNEMQKYQPFGWIKDRDGDKIFIGSINSDNSIFTCSSEILFLKELFEDFTFIDGIPFGVKEEEQLWHGQQQIIQENGYSTISLICGLAIVSNIIIGCHKIDMELMVFNFQMVVSKSLLEENYLGQISQLNLNKLKK